MHGPRAVNRHKRAHNSAHGKRPTGAPPIKAVRGLLQSAVLQVTDAKRAITEKAFINFQITASSLVAFESDNSMVVGKKYAELEGKVATAASVTQEHGKNQAALKAQLATKVSTDFSLPFPSPPLPSPPFPSLPFPSLPFLPLCPLLFLMLASWLCIGARWQPHEGVALTVMQIRLLSFW